MVSFLTDINPKKQVCELLKNKHVVLGITGSIAAYKACIVLRLLQSAGAIVRVVMTDAAQKFIGKLTFEALTQQNVTTDMFPVERVITTEHVHLAEWADVLLICPATANCIGKVASGIADDFLTTLIMASRVPVIFAPAMDFQMINNIIFRQNCDKLVQLGYHILATEQGALASGLSGFGRLLAPERIFNAVRKILTPTTKIRNKKLLISAGPTREYIDPVRFISNASSGKMGIALAEEAYFRGAEVTLICGPITESVIDGITLKKIETAREMADEIDKSWLSHDILIMTAAVADYRPKNESPIKIKKTDETWTLDLIKTQDILAKAAKSKSNKLVIGFALETDSEIENAVQKLKTKDLDLICLNKLEKNGNPFYSDENQLTLIDKFEQIHSLPRMLKSEAAKQIMDKIETLLGDL